MTSANALGFIFSTKDLKHLTPSRSSMVEKETGRKISCLRTDSGGEYQLTRFNLYCKQIGIRWHLTIACTPQENGISKYKNCSSSKPDGVSYLNLIYQAISGKKLSKQQITYLTEYLTEHYIELHHYNSTLDRYRIFLSLDVWLLCIHTYLKHKDIKTKS